MHAFKRKSPERDFKVLSNEVVKYADGLPLALKVLGSSLYGRNKEQCRDIIDRLKKIPNDDILGKLKIGLDGLNNEEMRTFLDIACLYNHEYRYHVERILESCGIHLIGISYLIEKPLLCIRYHSFEMHSLISQTGQNVSREEYANSRVWLIEEVHDLFAGKLKTKKVESLRIPNGYRFDDDHINYNKVFKRMQCLQVLILHRRTICSESTVTCLPSNLRWIEWPNYPSSSLPEGFEPSHLVGLCLRGSWLVELWPIPKKLCNLKYLNLSESLGLTKTPNFGDMPNLETLSLRRCENLEVVHPSLGHCKMLIYLSLTGCVKLKKLPKFVCMESLEILLLDECTSLKRFPKICGDMRRLSKRFPNSLFESQQWIFLYIYRCSGLVELPVSLGVQKKLGFLSVEECENLTKLPSSIQMESLTELKISNCPKLTTFPEIIGDMHCLKSMTLESTGIRELPLSIGNLSGLEYLNLKSCEDLVSLPNSLCKLKNLQRLILRGCKKLPGNVGDLQEFETLEEPQRSSK